MKFFFFLIYIESSIPAPYSKEYSRHIVLFNKQKKNGFLKFWNPPNPLSQKNRFSDKFTLVLPLNFFLLFTAVSILVQYKQNDQFWAGQHTIFFSWYKNNEVRLDFQGPQFQGFIVKNRKKHEKNCFFFAVINFRKIGGLKTSTVLQKHIKNWSTRFSNFNKVIKWHQNKSDIKKCL